MEASVKYSHEQRDGGCSIEVYLHHRSVKITMNNAKYYNSVIIKNVKTSQLLMLFRKPLAKMVSRQPNPFFVLYNFSQSNSRRFFNSIAAPIDGTLESISLDREGIHEWVVACWLVGDVTWPAACIGKVRASS